jgi:hypothetical protein
MMKKIALLSAVVLLSVAVDAGRLSPAAAGSQRAVAPTVDDPPPDPAECPLCGGNPMLHARRMLVIESLQSGFLGAALRW